MKWYVICFLFSLYCTEWTGVKRVQYLELQGICGQIGKPRTPHICIHTICVPHRHSHTHACLFTHFFFLFCFFISFLFNESNTAYHQFGIETLNLLLIFLFCFVFEWNVHISAFITRWIIFILIYLLLFYYIHRV